MALAREQSEGALEHAEAAERHDPEIPMTSYVAGRLAYAQAEYEKALTSFEAAARVLNENERVLEGVQWYLGDTLAKLDWPADAEKAFREELRAFPRQIPRLLEPRDALSRNRPPRRRQGDARRARRRGTDT